jgi:hypothetical protein
MCTVSFYYDNENVIITSNRDEHINRPLAIAPMKYTYKGSTLYFPKDPKAGGTWFVVKDDASAFVLLNGAERKHIPDPPYRESRGIILLDIAAAADLHEIWNSIDLNKIEPFTMITYVDRKLTQFRWDGVHKNYRKLDNTKPQIWSSVTLYKYSIIREREIWYDEFLHRYKPNITPDNLVIFHTNTKNDNLENGLVINREGQIRTKNITQFVLQDHFFRLSHFDLITNTKNEITEIAR